MQAPKKLQCITFVQYKAVTVLIGSALATSVLNGRVVRLIVR